MVDWGTIVAVLVGGGLTLLGSLLAHYLESRRRRSERRRERVKEQLQPARMYVEDTLRLADWVCSAPVAQGSDMDPVMYDTWLDQWSRTLDRFRSTDASWSALVVAVDDEALRDLMTEIRVLGGRLGWRSERVDLEGALDDEAFREREQLVELARQARQRIDELIEKA